MVEILTSLHGRKFGLGPNGALIVNGTDGVQNVIGARYTATITSAQLLALNATPITVLAAPGAGLGNVPRLVVVTKPAGTAYAGIAAGEDIAIKYTDASGAQALTSIEATGFLDQTTVQTRVATTIATNIAPVANAVLVAHMLTGEITTGTSPLYLDIYYDIIRVPVTA